MASYNNLSVTAALPDIGDDLGRVSLLPWVVTVELLAAAIAVLAVGPYIDGAGAAKAFRINVSAFLVTSAMCVVAPTMELLVVARVLQGLGSGALIGTALASIGLAFDSSVRPWAYALMASVWGIMGVGGPAIAAVLVSTLGWRAVFALNLPVGAAAAVVGWRRLPAQAQSSADRLDRRGLSILSVLIVAMLLVTSDLHWYSAVLLVAAAALTVLYVRHARRSSAPAVRLEHITAKRWRHIHIVAVTAVAGGTGASVYLPLYLKGARGSSSAAAAFAVVWLTVGWSAAAWSAGALQQRFRSQAVVLSGAVILAAGAPALTAATAYGAAVPVLLLLFAVIGWGVGTISTATLVLLQHRADPHEMGRVSSAHHFVRSLGFAYGAALAGLAMFWIVERRTGDAELVRDLLGDSEIVVDAGVGDALASAYTWSLGAMMVLCVLTVPPALALYRYNPDQITQD